MFLDQLFSLTGATSRYEFLEAATPEEMSAKFAKLIADVVAENVVREAAQLDPFNVYDVDIAGGGDGHTFVVKLLLSTWNPPDTEFTARWDSGVLSEIGAEFWLASTDEALAGAASTALAAFTSGGADTELLAVGFAGAAKGTRFMGFIAGVRELV